jgi:hypothetical protein
MSEDKSITMALESDDLGPAQELARAHKVNLEIKPQEQFIDPLSIVLIFGGAVAIAKFTVDLFDRFHGGVIVDLKPEAKQLVRRDKNLPYGWIVVVATDGKKVDINVKDAPKDTAERWVEDIINGVVKSANDVANSAAKAFGKDKVKPS